MEYSIIINRYEDGSQIVKQCSDLLDHVVEWWGSKDFVEKNHVWKMGKVAIYKLRMFRAFDSLEETEQEYFMGIRVLSASEMFHLPPDDVIILTRKDDALCHSRVNFKPKETNLIMEQAPITNYFGLKAVWNNMSLDSTRVKNVIFNNPATIVYWADGTRTVVKANGGDEFDPEKGLAMAIAKKALGNKGNYYNEFKKWLPVEEECSKKSSRVISLARETLDAIRNAVAELPSSTHCCVGCKYTNQAAHDEPCNSCLGLLDKPYYQPKESSLS